MKQSSTYFAHKFKPEAGKAYQSETKSDPKRCNDIGSSKAEHVNQTSGLNTKKGKEECIPVADVNSTSIPQVMAVSKTFKRAFNSNKDVKSELTGDSLLQHFGFELDATRVVQRGGPSDGHRRGGCGGGPGTANRGGRGRSNHGAQGAVSKNRTSLDPSVNIGCAKLLSYTAYGAYPQVQAFQNSAAFVSAAFGGSGIQVNGTRFAPVNESYQ